MLSDPYSGFVPMWQHSERLFRLFAFALVIVAILSFVGTARAWLALRSVRKSDTRDSGLVRATLAKLERDCVTRASRLQLMFYLFAAVTSWALSRCYFIILDGKLPLGFYVLGEMRFVFALAYWCALLFVVIHLVQWSTASRVAAAKRAAEGAGS